ncbi:hypothetical protein QFC21_001672 [Naganishia friedmannii]|uniref:Uncharacterized protein n=1 Tax=Naganishia friedmannii TaxID=89922 RepID=A0ACC2W1W1_9TREE|nr:hypothetical protein QFC21_001672 [Naganishia friedmannii]
MASPQHSESAKDTSSEEVSDSDEQMSEADTDNENRSEGIEQTDNDEDEMQDEEFPTLIEPNGYTSSKCGYCSPLKKESDPRTSRSYGKDGVGQETMYTSEYRAWKISIIPVEETKFITFATRSPDMANTCCPQYTIRLDAIRFDAGKDKKMRYLLYRWKRFVLEGNKPGDQETNAQQSAEKPKGKQKTNKANTNTSFDYTQELRATEHDAATGAGIEPSVRYEVSLVPAVATTERFKLYERYQEAIHKDRPGKNTMSGFDRFLCRNPLGKRRIPYPHPELVPEDLPKHYGCFHQLHRVDGKLIAFSVLDILPGCVSSVYFVWDPDYAWASLGKLSALRETALAKEFHKTGMSDMGWLYMGYYIWTCQKMRYKGEYSPSYLLDPGTNQYHPLETAIKVIELRPQGYTPFYTSVETLAEIVKVHNSMDVTPRDTTKSITKSGLPPSWPTPPPPSFLDPAKITKDDLRKLVVLLHGSLTLLGTIPFRDPSAVNRMVAELIAAVGKDRLATLDTLDRRIFLTF